ncbi:MAG: tetratricopeptide repeat protein [Xanthomonadales bacterium]|nr:tetratricopeptide repeat protein [Xanthomonadales bacterium]
MNQLPAFLLLTFSLAATAGGWDDDYRYGLESLERGQYQAAIGAFTKAIEGNPQASLATNGKLDYLPYLNLAVAYHQAGANDQAREALRESGQQGVVARSFMGRNLWDRYALAIMATDEQMVADTSQGDYREFERSDYTLSGQEARQIRTQVLRRCALSEKIASDNLPWYFHYEYGLELMEAGDPQRALDELILAANLREDSKRNSRMYGMWFTNYLPYYQIAQAHSKLGNWRCAMDAMRLSAQQDEFSPVDPGYQEYSDLQKLIMRQAEG